MKIILIVEPGALGTMAGIAVSGIENGTRTIRVDPTRLPRIDLLMPVIEHEIAHNLAAEGDYATAIGMHFMNYRKEKDNG